ncbi:MAG: sensor histidine kinase [Chitinophagaceae bacterium]
MSIFKNISRYWLFQAVGWGMFILINSFFALSYGNFKSEFLGRLVLFVLLGLIFTHLMRSIIKKMELLNKSLNILVSGFFAITIVFAMVIGILDTFLTLFFNVSIPQEKGLTESFLIFSNMFYAFVYLFNWNMIYVIYHYIEKSGNDRLNTLRLQALVKELELKTIKSHINPHFIFNALNSIRALIDENPIRARQAITELSNILRSSMQAENIEMVSFSKELDIVKDYLALEHIRFEKRLNVEYDINDQTLQLQVPYMMIQTLVENAIKHGISKNVEGGIVRITSSIDHDIFVISVHNTGILTESLNESGFGLQSTSNRLNLLFGGNAEFEIHQSSENMVEAKVMIPIHLINK